MTDLNQTQIEQTVKDLAEYAEAQAELRQAQTFGHVAIEGPDKGHNRRLEAAQSRFDSVLAKIPSRAEAESALLAEIQTLAAELDRLKAAFKSAVLDELDAVKARDAANQTLNYQQRFAILGLDPIKTAHAAHAAQEKLNGVIYARQVIEGKMDQTHKRLTLEYHVDSQSREHFPAAAARRVDSLLGDVYDRQHVASVKEQFGLTDQMLSRMVT